MATPKKDDINPSPEKKQESEKKTKLLDQDLDFIISKDSTPGLELRTDTTTIENQAIVEIVTERVQAITSLSTGVVIPESVIKKIRQNKIGSKFDTSQIVKFEDGPKVLSIALNAELGFTPEKLRKIAENLDPRIVIVVEGEVFFDKKLLAESFEDFLRAQQDKNLLQMSRSSRAALRRNVILREILNSFELILKKNPDLKDKITERINLALGTLYKSLANDDVLAFLQSSRINEEKRRGRAQEAELERLAIEQLEQLEAKKRL